MYFQKLLLHVHYPTQNQIYSEYQNNIKGQGQRQISRSSDGIRLFNPFCPWQEIAEYLMLFIPLYY